jgi:hypothetical protein
VSNSSANIDQLYAYYPYEGQRIAEKNGSFTQQRQYIGDEYDTGTSLKDPQSLNSYSEDNPVTKSDPSGKCPPCIAAALLGTIVVGTGLIAYGAFTNNPATYRWDLD